MSKWYSEGYDKKKLKSGGGNYPDQLLLKDGQEAKIRFRSDKAFCFNQHYVKSLNRYLTCLGDKCPMCKKDIAKSFKGAYPVIDRRDGKMKILAVGIKMLRIIDKYMRKYETLKDRDYELSREGASTSTVYSLIPDEKKKTTDKEKEMKKPDMQKAFMPKTREQILEMFEEVKASKDEEEDEDDVAPF